MDISKDRARKVAREDAAAAAKIIHVQELQVAALEQELQAKSWIITDLNAKLAAAEALLIVFNSTYDYVDGCTGEIVRAVWQHGSGHADDV
jgi:hypothetical protein